MSLLFSNKCNELNTPSHIAGNLLEPDKRPNHVRVCAWTGINMDTGDIYQPKPGDIVTHGISPTISQILLREI